VDIFEQMLHVVVVDQACFLALLNDPQAVLRSGWQMERLNKQKPILHFLFDLIAFFGRLKMVLKRIVRALFSRCAFSLSPIAVGCALRC
jgi:hypothetical protein